MRRVLRGELLTDEDLFELWCSMEVDLLQAGISHAAIRQASKRQIYAWHAKISYVDERQPRQPQPQVVGIPVVVGRR